MLELQVLSYEKTIPGVLYFCLAHLRVNQDPATVFAHNDLLPGGDVQLPLRWDLVKAPTTGIALNRHNSQSIACISPDLLVCTDEPWFDDCFQIGGFLELAANLTHSL